MVPTTGGAAHEPTAAGRSEAHPESITGILVTAATERRRVRIPGWTADMPRSALDREWDDLMALCRREEDLRRSGEHPKLLRLISRHIDIAARTLGFGDDQIRRREFRAEKEHGRVVRILTGQATAVSNRDDHPGEAG